MLPLLSKEIDPFAVLGLDQKCTLEDARKAYYKLALKYHPDTTKEDPEQAGLMFQRVGEAYRILSERPEFLSDSADTSSKSQVRKSSKDQVAEVTERVQLLIFLILL